VDNFFTEMPGVGAHEVIVETPFHNVSMTSMTDAEVIEVLQAYQERYNALSEMPFAKFAVIFKNHGPGAGTSLEHSHSQLVVTPIVPRYVRMRHEVAMHYHDKTGRCLYSDLVERELEIEKRIVMCTDKFVVLPSRLNDLSRPGFYPENSRPASVSSLKKTLEALRMCCGQSCWNLSGD
jgi:UDPglucose--hexose-1-phosphate uridylyltransferase